MLIETQSLKNRKVLVVGLARSGLAAAGFLVRQEARVTVTDRKPEAELRPYLADLPDSVRRKLGGHDLEDFLNQDLLVLSPGVPLSIPEIEAARRRGIPVWSEIELACRFLSGTIIGVTGSNGKTTTTTLIGSILRRAGAAVTVAGNIGTPLISCIDNRNPDRIFVVELSSFQLETTDSLRCRIALLLNITPDHMDRYADFESYARAKARIFRNQQPGDYAVLNACDPFTDSIARKVTARPLFISSGEPPANGCFVSSGKICFAFEGIRTELLPVKRLRLKGRHNLENYLAATAAAMLLDLPRDLVAETLADFKGVEHRLEFVREIDGVAFYNDSKATNVDSVIKAIEAFDRPIVAIMGGLDKDSDFRALREPVAKEDVKSLILIGSAADKLEASLGDLVPVQRAGSMAEAVATANRLARAGDIVLLSPACASFDMFENYEHRGREFKRAVQALESALPVSYGESNG